MAETVAIALLVAVGLGVGLAESRLDTVHAERLVIVTAGTAALGLAASGGVLVPLGVVLLFQLSALGYGLALRACLGLRGGASPWLELPAAMVLGWAVLVVVGLAAGTLGLLFAPFVAVVGLTGIALAVGSWGGVTMRSSPTPTPSGGDSVGAARTRPVVWWWLAAIGLVIYVAAIAPEARHDALAAHLPIAVEFAARRAIVEIPHNAASYFQLSADLLYAMAMTVVTGEAGPKLLHLTAGIVAVALVFRVGARLWDSLAGVIAAAILAGTPLVWWVAGTAYTDLWVLLFAVGALDALLSYQERPGTPRALGVSLLAGASLGVKMPAAVIVVPVVVVLLVWIVRSEKGRRRWLSLAATAAGLVLTGAYWYVRNYLLLGNPFHPLFGEMFGRPPLAAPLTPWTFGMGQRPVDLLLLPWRVTVLPHRFVEEGAIGFHYLLFSPLALVAVARGCAPRWLAATLLTAGAVWVAGAQYLRFALPILVPAALLTARGVALASPRARRLAYAVLVVAVSAEAIAWTTLKGPYFPVGVVTGTMSREAYLTEHVPGYRVAAYARRHLPASARLLSIGEDFVYFYERAV
ncbi:MAG: glycosyltransferase family 39 protein, partial [Armatimonadota bacterium]|nr:glycosyltransferase family 39 protein [Armatimonadota bacterium]